MNGDVKGNEHIFSGQDAFIRAYERARQSFEAINGVAGVGFGLKETGDQFTNDIAIIVFVREKRPDEDVPPSERIPATFEGYRTDVRVVGEGAAEGGCGSVEGMTIRLLGDVPGGHAASSWACW